jgi:hypothetical protein
MLWKQAMLWERAMPATDISPVRASPAVGAGHARETYQAL